MSRQSPLALGLKHSARVQTRRTATDFAKSFTHDGKSSLGTNVAVSAISQILSHFLKRF